MTDEKTVRRTVDIDDVIIVGIPTFLNPGDPANAEPLAAGLDGIAHRFVDLQWKGHPDPPHITHLKSDWTVTNDPAAAAAFRPGHVCVRCQAGKDQTLAYLAQFPGRWVGMGALSYTETWYST